ncbi:hypothetical protein SISSUDRAFT_317276 [Sistotremastrum suecicum HHB10207 ss-3]|uniref:Uncharacterized protein n=1 Tax=Sistotremastrum suecicum HHB10207 ss-3 TaxID=1314776 RepID=A0A165Z907_9AGAM|nr:hypothetical protein SISSUDRAFT_317276 [Sistotremastrum suecicum HHB10207 ss-3]
MLNVLAAELDGAYWISDTILDTLFPVDQRVYDGVRNSPELKRVYSLQPEHLQATRRPSIMHSTAPTAPNSLPATLQAWPATKDGERAHYPPLRTLINTILELTAAQIRRSRLPESQVLGKLVCSVYDRQVQASSHTKISGLSKNLLKPDLILCTRAVAPTDTCCWGDLDVVMEVKEHWPILFNQAATYARCMLAEPRAKSGHRRRFCIALLFNHDDMHLTLAVYHRSGCTRTIEMPIYTEAGLDRLVRIIVGIRSIPDLEDLGYDVSSDTNPLLKDFVYSKTLFYRSSVLGRATRVDERSDIPYEGTQSFLHSLYERDAEELTDALKRTTIRDREPERQPETAARRSTRIQKGKSKIFSCLSCLSVDTFDSCPKQSGT